VVDFARTEAFLQALPPRNLYVGEGIYVHFILVLFSTFFFFSKPVTMFGYQSLMPVFRLSVPPPRQTELILCDDYKIPCASTHDVIVLLVAAFC
jgi:hypothetical protein